MTRQLPWSGLDHGADTGEEPAASGPLLVKNSSLMRTWEFRVEQLSTAPVFEVPSRNVVAIEHPGLVLNLDNGLRTFGPEPNFASVCHSPPPPASVTAACCPRSVQG